ncbi:hypothetical protein HA378_29840, partial [Escherichia coli]|nr:hypothetical protein [Escherichia coli]
MSKIEDFERKSKSENKKITSLENNLKSEHDLVLRFSFEKAEALQTISQLEDDKKQSEINTAKLQEKISELTVTLSE